MNMNYINDMYNVVCYVFHAIIIRYFMWYVYDIFIFLALCRHYVVCVSVTQSQFRLPGVTISTCTEEVSFDIDCVLCDGCLLLLLNVIITDDSEGSGGNETLPKRPEFSRAMLERKRVMQF